jgi:hypothetical protein
MILCAAAAAMDNTNNTNDSISVSLYGLAEAV